MAMLGKTLAEVVTMTAFEARLTTQSSLTLDVKEHLRHLVRVEQATLLDEYDWPEFKGEEGNAWFDVELAAGQRYYDYPEGMDADSIVAVHYKFGNVWTQLTDGIRLEDYSAYDSDNDVRSDPPQKWGRRAEGQFEVWPMPATNGNLVRFSARQKVDEATQDAQVIVVDAIAVSLFAASRYLETDEGSVRSRNLYGRAQKRLTVLKVRKSKAGPRVNFAQHGPPPHPLDPRYRIRTVS